MNPHLPLRDGSSLIFSFLLRVLKGSEKCEETSDPSPWAGLAYVLLDACQVLRARNCFIFFWQLCSLTSHFPCSFVMLNKTLKLDWMFRDKSLLNIHWSRQPGLCYCKASWWEVGSGLSHADEKHIITVSVESFLTYITPFLWCKLASNVIRGSKWCIRSDEHQL